MPPRLTVDGEVFTVKTHSVGGEDYIPESGRMTGLASRGGLARALGMTKLPKAGSIGQSRIHRTSSKQVSVNLRHLVHPSSCGSPIEGGKAV